MQNVILKIVSFPLLLLFYSVQALQQKKKKKGMQFMVPLNLKDLLLLPLLVC